MRVALLTLLLGLTLAPWGHSAPPSSTLMFSLLPENDGAQTLISWSLSGPIRDSFAISGGSWTGVGNLFDGAFNSSYFTDSSAETFTVTGAGSFNDLTAATNVQVTQIGIGAYGSSRYIALQWGGATFTTFGNQVSYTPGTDSYVINVPFTAFNPGTYTTSDMRLQGSGMSYTTTVVPEPSAFSLLVLGIGGVAMLRRRG